MEILIAHKEWVMAVASFICFEFIPRVKPGWIPATKWAYDLLGKVIPDKQKK